jgi:hypothetical protein
MSKLKAEERDKGRRMVIEDFDAKAQANGFKDHDDFMAAVARLARTKPQQQPTEPKSGTNQQPTEPQQQPQASMSEEERAKYLSNVRRVNRARAREEKRRRELERELERKDVERLMERAAIRAGVQDVDYAMTLLNRKIQSMSPEEAKQGFDEEKFFNEELRKSHPILYGTETRPATTGTHGSAEPPKAPKPGEAPPGKEGDNGMVDARDLSGEDYQKLLEKMGLSHPAGGM